MPQAIGPIIAGLKAVGDVVGGVAAAAGTTTTNALIAVGVPTQAAIQIGLTVAAVTPAAINAVALTGVSLALAPSLPTPEAAKTNRKQPIPPRVSGYGRYRLGGAYMLREAAKAAYYVVATHDGLVDGIERYWLNDDEVTIGGPGDPNPYRVDRRADGSYGGNGVWIYHRLGLATETSYTDDVSFAPLGADVWTEDHRLDGIASLFLLMNPVEAKNFDDVYPTGAELGVSAEYRLQKVYDWRDEAQDVADPDTWLWSDNPVLCLAHYMCLAEGGPGYDWDDVVTPFEAMWTTAAGVCDELVPLKAGGTEKRYRLGLIHGWDNPPDAVINDILESMDGRLEEIDGGFRVWAGKYVAPTVTITSAHILSMSVDRFREDEEAVNELQISYNSPEHAYTTVQTTPWRNAADIAARGGRTKPEPFSPRGVQWNSQARRLAKRKLSRMSTELRGVMLCDYFGIQALGERYLRIQFPRLASTADIVVEVDPDGKIQCDEEAGVYSIPWVLADITIDDWNAATEEGDGPGSPDLPDLTEIPTPVIAAATAFFASTSSGEEGIRLRITLVDPEDASLGYALRWRVVGAVSWSESTYTGVTPSGGLVVIESDGFVPVGVTIEVEGALVNGAGSLSEWSETATVDTTLDNVLALHDGSALTLHDDTGILLHG